MGTPILSLHTSTQQTSAHAALQTVMAAAEKETLPQAAWELLVELIYNVYHHAGARDATDTPWGVEIVPNAETVELRVFDAGIGIAGEQLPSLFDEPRPSRHQFRGKGLLSLKRYAESGAVEDAKVSSDGTMVRLTGSYAMVTTIGKPTAGFDVVAVCRRDGAQ